MVVKVHLEVSGFGSEVMDIANGNRILLRKTASYAPTLFVEINYPTLLALLLATVWAYAVAEIPVDFS